MSAPERIWMDANGYLCVARPPDEEYTESEVLISHLLLSEIEAKVAKGELVEYVRFARSLRAEVEATRAESDALAELVERLEGERDAAREQARMSSFAGEGYAFMEKRAMDAEARACALAAHAARLEEVLRLPRLTDDVVLELRIAYVDHDDNRDEVLAAIIEWYLRARAALSASPEPKPATYRIDVPVTDMKGE